jgi:hypothetical protein
MKVRLGSRRQSIDVFRRVSRHTIYLDLMPAKSKKQQMAAGTALSARRGEKSPTALQGAAKQMYASMDEKELRDLASTKRKKLPTKKR